MANAKMIRARALRKGDKVGLLAPASSFSHGDFLSGCERLREMGYEPVYSRIFLSAIFILPGQRSAVRASSTNSGSARMWLP